MDPKTLVNRAQARCAQEHHGASDYCSRCIQLEMAEMIYEEHPEMCKADAEDVVSEWILQADAGAH